VSRPRDLYSVLSTKATPQTQPTSPTQIKNAAGGYVWAVGPTAQVHRFLTIGTAGSTYYASERQLTADTGAVVLDAARANATALVDQILAVSLPGRAPRNGPAVFALAAASVLGDDAGRKAALAAVPAVCRTATDLFAFAEYRQLFGGWGRGARRAVAGWYLERSPESLAYQLLKYRQRNGWTHRDVLRLAHPKTTETDRAALFEWATKDLALPELPDFVRAFAQVNRPGVTLPAVRTFISTHPASWEMIPSAYLNDPTVWRTLLAYGRVPIGALIRQLPRLTRLGVLDQFNAETSDVVARLTDVEELRRGRIHPVNLLVALRTYAAGKSLKGSSTWTPVQKIVDALDAAFYLAFATIIPAGKRTLVAVDVSSSMDWDAAGLPVTAREVAAAMAMVTVATEPDAGVVGFATQLVEVPISARMRLDQVCEVMRRLPFGGTDCAAPMRWAERNRYAFDTFVMITDNETWAGGYHVHQALALYRATSGIPARMAVMGVTATNCTVGDPDDPGTLNVAGFDSAAPALIADFSRGDL
jgi:60 kDa SS-A/Ro ribonucleoprotein